VRAEGRGKHVTFHLTGGERHDSLGLGLPDLLDTGAARRADKGGYPPHDASANVEMLGQRLSVLPRSGTFSGRIAPSRPIEASTRSRPAPASCSGATSAAWG